MSQYAENMQYRIIMYSQYVEYAGIGQENMLLISKKV